MQVRRTQNQGHNEILTALQSGCGRPSHAGRILHGYGFDFRILTHDEGNVSFVNNKGLGGRLPFDGELRPAASVEPRLNSLIILRKE